MHRDDVNIVDIHVPDSQSSSERSDSRIGSSLEHTVGSESGLLLSSSLELDLRDLLLDVLGGSSSLELGLEKVVLVLKPLSDLLPSESELSSSVLDVEERERVGGGKLSSDGEHSSSGSRDGSTSLVAERRKEGKKGRVSDEIESERARTTKNSRVSRGVSDDSLNRATHLESSSSAHDDLDSSSLSLHELMRRTAKRERVSKRLRTSSNDET